MIQHRPLSIGELRKEVETTRRHTWNSAPHAIQELLTQHLNATERELAKCEQIVKDWIEYGRL